MDVNNLTPQRKKLIKKNQQQNNHQLSRLSSLHLRCFQKWQFLLYKSYLHYNRYWFLHNCLL